MALTFQELIDIPKLKELMDIQYAVTGIPIGIIGIDGTIYVATGWQDICTKFHRIHPETARLCAESDNYIVNHLHGGSPVEYRCKNGLWDIAVPICIREKHLATLFVSQFHYEDEVPDREFFTRRAQEYGFDLESYLAALDRLPVFSRTKVRHIIAYYSELVNYLIEISLNRIERQEAFARLEKSEERFSLVMDAVNDGLWDWNLPTDEVYFNPNFFGMLGYAPGEKPSRLSTWHEMIHPDDRPNLIKVKQDCIENRTDHFESDFRMLAKNGEWQWIHVRGSAVSRGNDGRALRVIGTHTDITERKRTEEKLNKLALRYQTLQAVARDGIHILDQSGNLVESNCAFRRMLGYPEKGDLKLHVRDWDAGLSPEELAAKMSEIFHSPAVFETKWRRRDGTICDVGISTCSVHLDGVLHIYAAARDISGRKKLESSLRESRQFLSDIFDFLPDATFVVDREKTVIAWNRAMEEMSGVPKEQMRNLGDRAYSMPFYGDRRGLLLDLLDADEAELHSKYQRIARVGEHLSAEAFCPKLNNGKGAHIWAVVAPLYNSQGTTTGAIESIRDISAIKEMEANLARSNRELEQFAYVASHDLQEPLRKITGFTELLANRYQGTLDEKAESYMAYIIDGATRMRALINDLLSYSRLMRSTKEIARTDCSEVVAKVLIDLEPAIRESGAEIDCQPLPAVMGDPIQLGQLFQNLIGNAIKYCGDAPPQIRITAVKQGADWLFGVADKGIGIAPEFFQRIFAIFQRLHSRPEYPGTGIGLAICQKIVERHGGKIWVEAVEGKGSNFLFTLPVLPDDRELSE